MTINASDFNPASLTGTVTVNSSAGTSSTIVAADQTTEGPEKFVVKLRTGSASGTVVAVSGQVTINDTSVNNPTYSFQSNVASVNEGQSVKFTLITTDVDSGTLIPYTISGVSSADINGASLTGNFTVNNNGTATMELTLTTTADATTEGNETLTITLTSAPNNPSVSITINDTSGTPPPPVPTYALSSSLSNVNEGSALTFTLTTTNVANGTSVPYTITGITSADIGGEPLTGNFVVTSGTATAIFSIASDQLTEGAETMTMTLDGRSVSSSVVIADSSITPPSPPTYSLSLLTGTGSSVNEGATFSVMLTTTNVANGTSVPFTLTGIQQTDITGLTWDSANSRFTGAFTVNNNSSVVNISVVADALTEGAETMTMNLTNGQATGSLVINDTSITPIVSGSATITAANTREIPISLPATAMWLAFRVIGAGGSGGGYDSNGAGGSGGGAQYARGIVRLPATSGPKIIYGFVGRPARGGTSSGRNYDEGGVGENCTPAVGASGAKGEINGPSGTSGEGGGGGGASSLYFVDFATSSIIPIVTVGGGGGGGGGSHNRGDYGNANTENKGFITFGAGLTRTTVIDGLKAEWCRLDGGGGGGGGGAAGKEGYCGDDNDRGSKGGSAGYVIRNDSDGLTWGTFDWYGIGPVSPSTEGVAAEAPQPFPWVSFGRGGTGAVSGGTFGLGGQMGAIAMHWTTAETAPSYSNVPDWAFPPITIPASTLPNKDMQAAASSTVTFYSWGAVSYSIDGNVSTDCFIMSQWGNDPINGIGEFLEMRVVSSAPSNGTARGALSGGQFTENVWTPLKPNGPFGYIVGTTYDSCNATVTIRRRDNQAILHTVTYYNLTSGPEYPWWLYNA